MAERLPIDPHVVAYWGFDEPNETDAAVDEAAAHRHLSVFTSNGAVPGRVGNGRQFDGSTYAAPSDSAPFVINGDLTLIIWALISQYLATGSQERTMVSCEGTTGENTAYSLSVDKDGRVVYRHSYGSSKTVEMRTAPGTYKAGKFYSVVLTRDDLGDGTCNVELRLDNVLVAWDIITNDGAAAAQPVPSPEAALTAVLKLGKSSKLGDASWIGILDEMSVHDSSRSPDPYLTAAFYRVALASVTSRLTSFNNIQSIGAAETSSGSRWWVYERNQSLYVVREAPLGLFGTEVQLTTGGVNIPGGTSRPRLIYEPTSDTLMVAFIANGRVYRITANSQDVPAAVNVPTVTDTAAVVKAEPMFDAIRFGTGAPGAGPTDPRLQYVGAPAAPWICFWSDPFGVMIPAVPEASGFEVYEWFGGKEKLLATLTTPTTVINPRGGTYYFHPIPERRFGAAYFARPIRSRAGTRAPVWSNYIVDYLGGALFYLGHGDPTALVANRDLETNDVTPSLCGATAMQVADKVTYVNRTPLKQAFIEPGILLGSTGGTVGTTLDQVTYVNRTPLKLAFSEGGILLGGCGGGDVNLFDP